MEVENQCLMTENASLNQECRSNTERLKFLERERNSQRLQMKELECFLADLQNVCEKAEKDKRSVAEELTRQQNGFMELEYSKKDLEGQIRKLQASTEWRREKDDRVHELLTEIDQLRAELRDMEHHLLAKDSEVRDAEQQRAENREMEIQISKMVQQNIQLRRQLNDVSQSKESLEQYNEALQDELQNLRAESTICREVSPSIQCVLQDIEDSDTNSVHDTEQNEDLYSKDNLLHVIPAGNDPARTPPPISLAEEFEFSVYNSHSPKEDKDEAKMHDALDEYLHLTAAAVKIRYNMVPISSEELIQRVKNISFYKAHDELTKYMKEKLQEQEMAGIKNEQDYSQQQEPIDKEKDEALAPNAQNSVVEKFRRFFRSRQKLVQMDS